MWLYSGLLSLMCLWLCLAQKPPPLRCRDPDHTTQIPADQKSDRSFLLIGGAGAGIGNFLIFYPAAYYFALLTGRDILILDDSLIGEMCKVLQCGYPFYNDMKLINKRVREEEVTGAGAWDFQRHFSGENIITAPVVRADGSKLQSGWYASNGNLSKCIARLTNCQEEDVHCHDRHALQSLVRGPFRNVFTRDEEKRIVGVPKNLKHAMMILPHAYAPRLDCAIHLRAQFSQFEQSIGPDDGQFWIDAIKERDAWLKSKEMDSGQQLFKLIEQRIMEEMPLIRGRAQAVEKQRRRLIEGIKEYYHHHQHAKNVSMHSGEKDKEVISLMRRRRLSRHHKKEDDDDEAAGLEYNGEDVDDEKIFVYLASDNERVKEAMAHYLRNHSNIAVMRIHNNAEIAHAKNLHYLKHAGNSTGVMDLVVDWYALSLANVVFAWRRGTDFISTFAHSAQRLSGNTETSDHAAGIGHGIGSKGLSLYFKNGGPHWRYFY